MHLVDQLQRQLRVSPYAGGVRQAEKIADGERVGPEITLRRAFRDQTGALREARHQVDSLSSARIHGAPVRGRDQCTTSTGRRAPVTTRCERLPRLPLSSALRPRLPITIASTADSASRIASSGGFDSTRVVHATPACS